MDGWEKGRCIDGKGRSERGMQGRMDGWMKRWMEEWIKGWMEREVDG